MLFLPLQIHKDKEQNKNFVFNSKYNGNRYGNYIMPYFKLNYYIKNKLYNNYIWVGPHTIMLTALMFCYFSNKTKNIFTLGFDSSGFSLSNYSKSLNLKIYESTYKNRYKFNPVIKNSRIKIWCSKIKGLFKLNHKKWLNISDSTLINNINNKSSDYFNNLIFFK